MNIQILTYFKTVASLEHLTKAAEQLNIAQSSLSRSIKNLEEELQVPLFNHQKNRIKLNQNGEKLLVTVNQILLLLNNTVTEIREDENFVTKALVFQINSAGKFFPDLMRDFKQLHPDTKFVIEAHRLDAPFSDQVDLILCSSLSKKLEFPSHMLIQEKLYITVSCNHQLADADTVEFSSLAKESFLFSGPQNDMHAIQMAYCKKAGIQPRIIAQTDKQNILLRIININEGISLLPKLQPSYGVQNLIRQIPISDIDCYRYVHLVANPYKYQTKISKQFQRFCIHYFQRATESLSI